VKKPQLNIQLKFSLQLGFVQVFHRNMTVSVEALFGSKVFLAWKAYLCNVHQKLIWTNENFAVNNERQQ